VATVLMVVLLLGCSASDGDGRQAAQDRNATPSKSFGIAAQPSGSAGGDVFAKIPDVVEKVEPSVVTIFAGAGVGSGVVYTSGGAVVTNAHVVGAAKRVEMAFADGTRVGGRVLALDPITDIAVVQSDRTNLPAATFAKALPRVGTLVLAIGSPLGFENTVTAGIVSGIGREIPGSARSSRALVDLVQTDAAISPGNSGGALVDTDGKVVGINEAYIPPSTGAVSLGFAIPAATVVDVADQLIKSGKARHPFLGIEPATLSLELSQALDVGVTQGVLVRDVGAGGPAAKAGIRRGDVMTKFNGELVRSVEEFLGALREVDPGDQVDVEVHRAGRGETLSVTLGELTRP
jgi:S1-C subfamily serine protease